MLGHFKPQRAAWALAAGLPLLIAAGSAQQLAGLRPSAPAVRAAASAQTTSQRDEAWRAYGRLPVSFVPNAGQLNPKVLYSAQGSGYAFAFTKTGARLSFQSHKQGDALDLNFVNSSSGTEVVAQQPAGGKVNFLIGSDLSRWRIGLPTFGQLVYRHLWPGIDLVFKGDWSRLTYELTLQPQARVADIGLQFAGAKDVSLDTEGNLLVRTSAGLLKDERPVTYQVVAGKRVPIASGFVLSSDRQVGFTIGAHDSWLPLVIDPGLIYSTFIGGSGTEVSNAIAVDTTGAAYITGWTTSTNFPTTATSYDTSYNGGTADVFVTKLNSSGSALDYSTYLGGGGADFGQGIAVDAAGEAYVTGWTQSANFPTTPGAFQTTATSNPTTNVDAFVTKFNSTGTLLLYSTRLGGNSGEQGFGITIDALGDAYVTGNTSSTNFPTTPTSYDTSYNQGGVDAFVTKLNPAGTAPLLYSTYLGGSGLDQGFAIAIDAADDAYVTGSTGSTNFPTTATAYDTTFNGGFDAYVTKFNPAGSAPLMYSTYLGGSSFEFGRGIAVDSTFNAYLTGSTSSSNFPTTVGAYDTTYNGNTDAFVSKINTLGLSLASLVYSTFLGGGNYDEGRAMALDASGDAHVTGLTLSANFPTTVGAYDTSFNGVDDVFFSKLNPSGSMLLYSTYIGGSNYDDGYGVALDATGAVYVTGDTGSSNYPTTAGAYDTTYNGGGDAFVTKLAAVGAPATITLMPVTATNPVGATHCVTATVRDISGQPVPGVPVVFTVLTATLTHATPSGATVTTDANGQAQFCYTAALPGVDTIRAFADTNGNGMQDVTTVPPEPVALATKIWTAPVTSGTCKITNSGWITALDTDRGDFNGEVHVANGQISGHESYLDRGPVRPESIDSSSFIAVVCPPSAGMAAQIYGNAKVTTATGPMNVVFLITLTDGGNGGKNDTYGIIVSDGYVSGQKPLGGGNINIR